MELVGALRRLGRLLQAPRDLQRERARPEQLALEQRQLVAEHVRERHPGVDHRERRLAATAHRQRRADDERRSQPRLLKHLRRLEQRAGGDERVQRPAERALEPATQHDELVAQRAIADGLLGVGEQVVGLDRPVEAPEEVARTCDRHLDALRIGVRLALQRLEQRLGVVRLAGGGERPGQRQPRSEAATFQQRRPRKALGQRRVERRQRLLGGAHEQVGVAPATAVQAPRRDAQDIAAAARAASLDGIRQAALDRFPARAREPRSDHLAVQRVGNVDKPAAAVVEAHDELAPLELLERRDLRALQQPELERRTDGDDLQQAERRRVQRRHPRGDELAEAHPDGGIAIPAPDPAVLDEQVVLDAVVQELAQEQRVAARVLPQQADAAGVDGRAEHGEPQQITA